jgi:hypothetical protein
MGISIVLSLIVFVATVTSIVVGILLWQIDLLTVFLPAEDIRSTYIDAVKKEYLWHEFGDLNLLIR